jgi:hypothetical protein
MATCCTSLGNIEKICGGGNAAGLRTKLYVACVDQVDTIPAADVDTFTISTDITMVADIGDTTPGLFYEINISKNNGTYTAENQGDDENPDYLHTLTFNVLKMTAGKNYILNGMAGGEHIVVWKDRNDTQWLMGNLDEGATVQVTPNTADFNGYTLTITWRSSDLLYNYTGALSVAA